MRRALATFSVENRGKSPAKDLRLLVTAFTYGGGAPTTYRATIHRAVDSPPLPLDQAVEEAPEDSLTGTEPIRVTERVLI
jgi:hypothetical protein